MGGEGGEGGRRERKGKAEPSPGGEEKLSTTWKPKMTTTPITKNEIDTNDLENEQLREMA
jgi:hypothetical protein